jgi:serine/threonine protein kinase
MAENAFTELSASSREFVALSPGAIIAGRFEVRELAGRGGMGVVYRGVDLHTRAEVAIKLATAERPGSASRFAQEVAVLSRLSHPAIVRYIASGKAPQGMPFLVMEWLAGETLAVRLLRESPSVEDALAILRRTSEALAVAHAAGVVHRDLKPSNLLLVHREIARLKVLDFGIARHGGGEHTLTQSGTMLGTLGYMAPEQALGSPSVDARADVFALGCLFFECLTGRAAFTGINAVAVLAKILQEDPPPLSELRPELSDQLADLLARMLAKDSAARPRDASAVLHELDQLGPAEATTRVLPRVPRGLTSSERKVVAASWVVRAGWTARSTS